MIKGERAELEVKVRKAYPCHCALRLLSILGDLSFKSEAFLARPHLSAENSSAPEIVQVGALDKRRRSMR